MRLKLRKCAVLGLILSVFISAILCCCITDMLHAQEPVPSCHSAHPSDGSPQKTDDCDCSQSMAIVEQGAVFEMAVDTTSFMDIVPQAADRYYHSNIEPAAFAPPIFYDTSPLYIKHSILRI